MMKEKGRGVYRNADRFLVERLVKRGHTQGTIRNILYRASPELMNQKPGERKSWVWRLVSRVYKQVKHQKAMIEKQKIVAQKNKKMNEEEKEKPVPEQTKETTSPQLEPGIVPADFPFNPSGLLKGLVKKGIKNADELWKTLKKSKSGQKPSSLNHKEHSNIPKTEEKSQLLETKDVTSKSKDISGNKVKNRETVSESQKQPPERQAKQQAPPERKQNNLKPEKEPESYQKIDKFSRVTKEVLKAEKKEENSYNKFQKITKEVLADQTNKLTQPQESGEKPDVQIYKTSEKSLLANKEYLQAKVPWLKNEESAKRYHEMCKNYPNLKDKDWHSLDSKERYQKHFMSEEFKEQFEEQDYASREADKSITKGMINQTLGQAGLESKNAEQIGNDLLQDHLAIVENSPHAARFDDPFGYAGRVFEDAWNEKFNQDINIKPERAFSNETTVPKLSDISQSYKQSVQAYQIQQAQQISPDLGY
jgi:hypothetical protein